MRSQSPRFGSRCFVLCILTTWATAVATHEVAIPSVRVSVFRPDIREMSVKYGRLPF